MKRFAVLALISMIASISLGSLVQSQKFNLHPTDRLSINVDNFLPKNSFLNNFKTSQIDGINIEAPNNIKAIQKQRRN